MCSDAGSTISVMHCQLHGNQQSGVFATGHCAAVVQSCRSQGNKKGGFWAQFEARLTLSKCSSDGDEHGCGVSSGATLTADNCTVRGSKSAGYQIEGKTVAKLTKCDAKSCVQFGILAAGAGTKLCMEERTLSSNGWIGLHVLSGAEGKLRKVKSEGHVFTGFACIHNGSYL